MASVWRGSRKEREDPTHVLLPPTTPQYLEVMEEERAEEEAIRQLELEEAAAKAAEAARQAQAASAPAASAASPSKASAGAKGNGSGASGSGAEAAAGSKGGSSAAAAAPAAPRKISYYENLEYKKVCAEMEKLNATKDKLDAKVRACGEAGEGGDGEGRKVRSRGGGESYMLNRGIATGMKGSALCARGRGRGAHQ